ncbi:MAG TPA: hypothetical protein VFH80_29310 [Solirubrobacteraceae bacterium]|nr:hypothetical protein [Solirubrobacteraceae bacterium]
MAATAWAAPIGSGPSDLLTAAAKPATQGTTHARVLFGDTLVEPTTARLDDGKAIFIRLTNHRLGTARWISVYVARHSSAKTLIAGLYADHHGLPGALLTSGSRPAGKAGSWEIVKIKPTRVKPAQRYWVAILARAGALVLRDRRGAFCATKVRANDHLGALPAQGRASHRSHGCFISAYVMGSRTSMGTPTTGSSGTTQTTGSTQTSSVPPLNVTPPAITGIARQGQPLSASTGSWSNSPSAYAYQWRDCSKSACTSIAGATGPGYTLQASDVGNAIDVVVTATNSVGSVSATSSTTAIVTTANGFLYGSEGGPYSSALQEWPGQNWEPYAASSWANTPLPSWRLASLYSDSANAVAYMDANWPEHWTSWTFSQNAADDMPSVWGHPLYFATNSDPLYTITDPQSCSLGNGTATFCPTKLRIPNEARAASGSDGHIEVVEPAGFYSSSGTDPQGQPPGAVDEIDFYQVGNSNAISGGGSITASSMGGLDFDGNGCCGFSTALNQGLAGLMIRAQDLQSGTISHALGGSFQCTNGTNVAPWPLNGGGSPCPSGGDGPPMGSRLQLKMDDSTIDGLNIPAWEKIVYKALSHYGLYVTDTGGSPMDPEFEPAIDYTSFGDTSNTLMSYFRTQGFTDPYSVTITIPWSDYQIVSSCYAQSSC